MNRSLPTFACAFAIALLLGQITDKTTGQPLRGVQVRIRQGAATLRAVTGEDGRFRLSGVRPGAYVLNYSSDDVPPGSVRVRVSGAREAIRITACSTTLDYSCTGPGGGG
jgi:hypothetical protein